MSGIGTIGGVVIGCSWADPCEPQTGLSAIADCPLGDEYVKIFPTGSREGHREARGKPTFPVFPCVLSLCSSVIPVVKIFAGGEKASAGITSVPPIPDKKIQEYSCISANLP